MVAGVTKDQFTKVFTGDTDKCGAGCPGYSTNPNTPSVIDKHWGFFTTAAAARGFSLQVRAAAIIRWQNILCSKRSVTAIRCWVHHAVWHQQ